MEKLQKIMADNADVMKININRDNKEPGTFLGNIDANVKNTRITQSDMNNLSSTVSNPFESISTLFNNVPLVNIDTQNITIQVPFIYAEDITRYAAYLQTWLQKNTASLQEWGKILRGAIGFCNKSYDSLDAKNAATSVASTTPSLGTEELQAQYKELQEKAKASLQLKKDILSIKIYGKDITTTLQRYSLEKLPDAEKTNITTTIGNMTTIFGKIVAGLQKVDETMYTSLAPDLVAINTSFETIKADFALYSASETDIKTKKETLQKSIGQEEISLQKQKAEAKSLQSQVSVAEKTRTTTTVDTLQSKLASVENTIQEHEKNIDTYTKEKEKLDADLRYTSLTNEISSLNTKLDAIEGK